MGLLEILAVAVVLFVAAAVAAGRGDLLAPAPPDGAEPVLPADRVAAANIEGLRFAVAVRGYRMDQVDAVLARLAAEIDHRDAELALLQPANPAGASPESAEGAHRG